jgi:hypothetical protein
VDRTEECNRRKMYVGHISAFNVWFVGSYQLSLSI